MQRITVALADRSRASQAACFESLQQHDNITIVARVASRFDVVEASVALRPSIIVCGMSLAADFGHWLLKTVRRECPSTRILLVTDTVLGHDEMVKVLDFGPLGFVARKLVPRQLPHAIRGVARGEAWLPRKVLGMLVEQALR
jgi:DNA-binding NarL/FixJ family response regulator